MSSPGKRPRLSLGRTPTSDHETLNDVTNNNVYHPAGLDSEPQIASVADSQIVTFKGDESELYSHHEPADGLPQVFPKVT